MLKVIIADDSAAAARVILKLLSKDSSIKVIDIVNNGKAAVRSVADNKPDIVLMDLNMPVMDGMEATSHIMANTPVPILILTAKASVAPSFSPYQAIKLGAVEVMEKPTLKSLEDPRAADKLLTIIKNIAKVKVVTHKRSKDDEEVIADYQKASAMAGEKDRSGRQVTSEERIDRKDTANKRSSSIGSDTPTISDLDIDREIVAIVASTGGPKALHQVLSDLPKSFSLPIVIVQHMLEGFTEELINWLNKSCPLNIQLAKNRQALMPGSVYFCPDNAFIAIGRDRRVQLMVPKVKTDEEQHILSGNSLLVSIAEIYGKRAIGVVLTGMGDDGAMGLKKIRDKGGATIAQDEETSVVYGMPKVAAGLGGAQYVIPIQNVSKLIIRLARQKAGGS